MAMMYGRHSLWLLPTDNIMAYLGATGNCDIVLPSGVRLATLLSAGVMRNATVIKLADKNCQGMC